MDMLQVATIAGSTILIRPVLGEDWALEIHLIVWDWNARVSFARGQLLQLCFTLARLVEI